MAGIGDNLAGIMGVMQKNKALREDRRQFDLNLGLDQRKLADAEKRTGAYVTAAEAQAAESQARIDEVDRKNAVNDARQAHYGIQEQGIINPESQRVDTDAVWLGLETGHAPATQGTIDLLNYGDDSSNLTPEGFKIDGITPTKDGYVIEGVYADGKRGVLTQEGGSGDDEKVMVLDKKTINHLLNQAHSQIMEDGDMADRNLALHANVAVAEAAANQYQANQTHLDMNENAVVSTISGQEQAAGSDRQASRAMISALSSAETEAERQGILLEFASEYKVELPYMEEAQAAVSETAPAEEPETYGKGRTERSRQLADQRKSSRREALPNLLAEAEADLAQVREDFAERGYEPRRSGANGELEHPTIQQRVDKITNLKAEMEEAGIAPAPEPSVDYKALEQRVTSFIAEMPEGDLATAVENGDLQFTEQDTAAVSQRMQEQNVTTAAGIADMQRVEDQAIAYAMLATYAPDPTTRDWATKQIRNLGETGTPSMSTNDALTARTNQQNANANSLNAEVNRRNSFKNSTLNADGVLDEVNTIRQLKAEGDWDMSNPSDAQRLFSLINLGDEGGQQYTKEFFAAQINEAVVDVANNPDSWWKGFLSLFDTNAVQDPTSFKYENVRVRTNDDGDAVEFFYVNNNNEPAGQPIPASDMRRALSGSQAAFDAVTASAKRNSGI